MNFVDQMRLFFITTIRYSPLRRPPGKNYIDVAAECLGIPVSECRRLQRYGASDRQAHRLGCRFAGFAIKKRGSLENLPPFLDLICEVDIAELCEWLSENRVDELEQWWVDLNTSNVE